MSKHQREVDTSPKGLIWILAISMVALMSLAAYYLINKLFQSQLLNTSEIIFSVGIIASAIYIIINSIRLIVVQYRNS